MNQNSPCILVVDDDKEICELLQTFLSQHGFMVHTAGNGAEMAALIRKPMEFDVILLDVMLPGEDGMSLCRRWRAELSTPIILLTAVSEETDKIVGLELGADDYVTKPFNPRELLARIRAVTRRTQLNKPLVALEREKTHVTYQFESWSLDKNYRELLDPQGVEVSLSTGEYDLLLALVEHAQHILSRDQLLDITRNRSAGPFDRSIDVQISRLRQKIEWDPKKPTLIKTVRGGGYMLSATVKRIENNASNTT